MNKHIDNPAYKPSDDINSIVRAFKNNKSQDEMHLLYPPDELLDLLVQYQHDPKLNDLLNESWHLLERLDTVASLPRGLRLSLFAIAKIKQPPSLKLYDLLKESVNIDLLKSMQRHTQILDDGLLSKLKLQCQKIAENFNATLEAYQKSSRPKTQKDMTALNKLLIINWQDRTALSQYIAVLHDQQTNIGYNDFHFFAGLHTYSSELLTTFNKIISPIRAKLFCRCMDSAPVFATYFAEEEFVSILETKHFQALRNVHEKTYHAVITAYYPNHPQAQLEPSKDRIITLPSSDKKFKAAVVTEDQYLAQLNPPKFGLRANFFSGLSSPYNRVIKNVSFSTEMGMAAMRVDSRNHNAYTMEPTTLYLEQDMEFHFAFLKELEQNPSKIGCCITSINNLHPVTIFYYNLANGPLHIHLIDPDREPGSLKQDRKRRILDFFVRLGDYLGKKIYFDSSSITQQENDRDRIFACLQTGMDLFTKDLFVVENNKLSFKPENITLNFERDKHSFGSLMKKTKETWLERLYGSINEYNLAQNWVPYNRY